MIKIIAWILIVCFILTNDLVVFSQQAHAQELVLPKPGAMLRLSPPLDGPILKGIKVNVSDPFKFEFVLDIGERRDNRQQTKDLKEESTRLIKYFLASLTIPERDLWVNLSPYEKDRVIPDSFGITEMGRDLLAQDYILKQVTASLIYPEDEIGRRFWKRVYEKAAERYKTTNIPVNTFNKVWIVPERAVVYENSKAGTAYVVESRLKVMLEEDFLSREKNMEKGVAEPGASPAARSKARTDGETRGQDPRLETLGSEIVREIVIPELTREVNEGKNFAQLRQVYNSLILATWYKKKIKDSILNKVYADKNKTASLSPEVGSLNPEAIYKNYLQAFKKGVYNYIKEDVDLITQEPTPRQYFSGGANFNFSSLDKAWSTTDHIDPAQLTDSDRLTMLSIQLEPVDKAMNVHDEMMGYLKREAEGRFYFETRANAIAIRKFSKAQAINDIFTKHPELEVLYFFGDGFMNGQESSEVARNDMPLLQAKEYWEKRGKKVVIFSVVDRYVEMDKEAQSKTLWIGSGPVATTNVLREINEAVQKGETEVIIKGSAEHGQRQESINLTDPGRVAFYFDIDGTLMWSGGGYQEELRDQFKALHAIQGPLMGIITGREYDKVVPEMRSALLGDKESFRPGFEIFTSDAKTKTIAGQNKDEQIIVSPWTTDERLLVDKWVAEQPDPGRYKLVNMTAFGQRSKDGIVLLRNRDQAMTVQRSVMTKKEWLRDVLLDLADRPDPLQMLNFIREQGLSVEDIHEIAKDEGYREVVIAKTIHEVDALLSYVMHIVDVLYQGYGHDPKTTILFAGRDAENIYDAYMVIADLKGRKVKAKLFPGSKDFWTESAQPSIEFFEQIGLTSEAFKEGEKFVLLDTGYVGTIGDKVSSRLKQLYPDIEKVPIANLLIKSTESKDRQLRLDFPQRTRASLENKFPRALLRYSGLSATFDPYDQLGLVVRSLQKLPRFHGPYQSYNIKDNKYVYTGGSQEPNDYDHQIDNVWDGNPNLVNPYAALLVQYRFISQLSKDIPLPGPINDDLKKNITSKGVRYIPFAEFQTALHRTVDKVDERLAGFASYGILLGAVAHESKRWVYELSKGRLSKKPRHVFYLKSENRDRLQDLDAVLILDDTVWGGRDILTKQLTYLKEAGFKGKIIIAAPYMGSDALAMPDRVLMVKKFLDVEFIYEERMEDQLPLFDHNMHEAAPRFLGQEARALSLAVVEPYKQVGTAYYAQEEKDFQQGVVEDKSMTAKEVVFTSMSKEIKKLTFVRTLPQNYNINQTYLYKDDMGNEYFVKPLKQSIRAVAEYIGYRFYKILGLPVPDSYEIMQMPSGQLALVTPFIKGFRTTEDISYQTLSSANQRLIRLAYYADAFLNIHDRHAGNIRVDRGGDEEKIAFFDWELGLGLALVYSVLDRTVYAPNINFHRLRHTAKNRVYEDEERDPLLKEGFLRLLRERRSQIEDLFREAAEIEMFASVFSAADFESTRFLRNELSTIVKGAIDEMLKDSAQLSKGGIDLNAERLALDIKDGGAQIAFKMDEKTLQRLEASSGFYPVIINIQPLGSLKEFLSVSL